jgi:hypothetical protein
MRCDGHHLHIMLSLHRFRNKERKQETTPDDEDRDKYRTGLQMGPGAMQEQLTVYCVIEELAPADGQLPFCRGPYGSLSSARVSNTYRCSSVPARRTSYSAIPQHNRTFTQLGGTYIAVIMCTYGQLGLYFAEVRNKLTV